VPLNVIAMGLDFCGEAALHARLAIAAKTAGINSHPDEGKGTGGAGANGSGTHDLEPEHDLVEAVKTLEETLPSLEAAAESMQTTLNDILDLQSIESGRFRIDKKWVRLLPDVLEETRRTFQAQADGVGVDLSVYCPNAWAGQDMYCDSIRLRGALYNFASNALKWSRPHERSVHRLRDATESRGGIGTRPRVVIGASRLPPYLWDGQFWDQTDQTPQFMSLNRLRIALSL